MSDQKEVAIVIKTDTDGTNEVSAFVDDKAAINFMRDALYDAMEAANPDFDRFDDDTQARFESYGQWELSEKYNDMTSNAIILHQTFIRT